MRIRIHLVLMVTAIVLPVGVAAGFSLVSIRDNEREAAFRGLRETARATSLIVDREIQGSLSALKALGQSKNLESQDFSAFYKEAAALDQMPDVWTVLFDAAATQLVNTVVPFGTSLPTLATVEQVSQAFAAQKPLVSDLAVWPVTGRLLTGVYVPAAVGGGGSLLVAQAFTVDHWTKTAIQSQRPPDRIVAVIDRNGRFIARSHKIEELLGQPARPELVKAAADNADGLIRHRTVEGLEAYHAFTHSSLTGWTIAVAAPVESVEAPARRAVLLALMGMLFALGVAAAAVAAFGRQLVQAIEQARTAAVALGKGGSPEPGTALFGLSEIDQLNDALVDAGRALDAVRKSRVAAEREYQRLLQNETAARQAAQAQDEARDQFLAMLGHELRNPLAAISSALTLLETGLDQEQANRYLAMVRRQNGHLEHLANDLLDVSRLLAGKITLEPALMNLADCVSQCVESLQASDMARGHHIEVRAEPVWVQCDAVRIEQILNNLITNALKFSPVGSQIEVEAYADGAKARVNIRDHGVGIAAYLLPHVFDPFVQGPPPLNRGQTGLGIGLALVKRLVALHGGEVSAASLGADRGSTFSFWMPRTAPAHRPAAATHIANPGRRRLVYVEDDSDARVATAEMLRTWGYEVMEVAEGKSAHAAVLAARPDVVLLNIGLPDMDGYAVARELRDDVEICHIPLIAVTGYGQLRDKERATIAGFDAHLVKPVTPDDLVRAIEAVASESQAATGHPGC